MTVRPAELCGTYYARTLSLTSVRLVRRLGFRGLFSWVFGGAQRKNVVRHCAPCAPPCAPPAASPAFRRTPPKSRPELACAPIWSTGRTRKSSCAPPQRVGNHEFRYKWRTRRTVWEERQPPTRSASKREMTGRRMTASATLHPVTGQG